MSEPVHKLYDIAVIGGGIAGAGIARDAALRGLSVVLFEKNTFASGSSSKSSKLVHGGIRYLEVSWDNLKRMNFSEGLKNFRFVFTSLRESRVLAKTAPSFIRPLSLVIPVYKNGPRKPFLVYFGAYLYYFLSLFSGGGPLPQVFKKKEDVLKLLPGIRSEDLAGAVRIWDYCTDDKTLVLAVMESAKKLGSEAYEHTEVTNYRFDSSKKSYELKVLISGKEEFFRARTVANASGPWVDKVRAKMGESVPKYIDPVGGSHIHVPRFLPESVILQAKDGRVFFVINIGNEARVGTTEWPCTDPDKVITPESDIEYLLESLKFYFPEKNFTRKDILRSDTGVRPLAKSTTARKANEIPREHELRFETDGVLHVIGVKLTDYRRAAEEAVDKLLPSLGTSKKSMTKAVPLV